MNETAWQNLEEDKQRRLPTPPVGWMVQWYPGGDQRQPVAAVVVAAELPGRVKLKTFPANSFPKDMAGVWHVKSKVHDKTHNQTTAHCGSWDYPPGQEVPKLHWKAYDEDLERREAMLMAAEDQAARQTAQFQAKQAKKAQEAKKQLPEILPAQT